MKSPYVYCEIEVGTFFVFVYLVVSICFIISWILGIS